MGRSRKALVAPPTRPAARDDSALARCDQVVAGAVILHEHLGAGRNRDLQRLTVRAVAQRSLSVAAALGLEVGAAAEPLQVADRVVADEHDVAAPAAVAAVGAALRDVRLAPEAEAAIAAPSGLNVDPRAVVHPYRMADPVFLITGASSGIGAATARHAAQAGYRLVLAARSSDPLKALVDELGGAERALAVTCDVTEWAQQQAVVAEALDRFGRIDVAFANAGFGAKRGFLEESPEHWRAMVLTNVYGAALTIRATLPSLKESQGHLLLTGSVAGRRALPGSLYSATKWAVTGDGRVRAPGAERNRRAGDRDRARDGRRRRSSRTPPANALEPDDVARAVMFAVSQPPHVDVNEILVRPTAQDG